MSTTLDTSTMVAQLGQRLPLGYSSGFLNDKLNQAFRYIDQQGNFVWQLALSTPTVLTGTNFFTIPSTIDYGKPMMVAGPVSGVGGSANYPSIQWLPFDKAYQLHMGEIGGGAAPGNYSGWTNVKTNAILFPSAAAPNIGNFSMVLIGHSYTVPLAYGAGIFFPTPDCFDDVIVDLAEAEVRRIYSLPQCEYIMQRAQSGLSRFVDLYRSTKDIMSGLMEEKMRSGETIAAIIPGQPGAPSHMQAGLSGPTQGAVGMPQTQSGLWQVGLPK